MALTTLTNLKTDLGITGTDDDTKLTRLIGSVSAAIRAYCKREFGGVTTSVAPITIDDKLNLVIANAGNLGAGQVVIYVR